MVRTRTEPDRNQTGLTVCQFQTELEPGLGGLILVPSSNYVELKPKPEPAILICFRFRFELTK